jgi:hypothetical protein
MIKNQQQAFVSTRFISLSRRRLEQRDQNSSIMLEQPPANRQGEQKFGPGRLAE